LCKEEANFGSWSINEQDGKLTSRAMAAQHRAEAAKSKSVWETT
jgi:hypothetical protein